MNDPRLDELRKLLPQAMLPDWVRLGLRANRLFRDRLHPDKHDAVLNRLFEQVHASIAVRERRLLNLPAVSYPAELPITSRKDEIVAAIRAHQVVVIAGETGSGKTTQLPKMCLDAGLGIKAKIGCTQPRRVAALSISRRIAEELNVGWGREVGCKIRFDDRSSTETYIKLMTDGILLAEAQGDPQLSDYDCIIIDEAHERSLNIDFLLGLLKGLLTRRRDLKLIVTSATIDTQAFSRHFNDAPIIEVSGRLYPVDVIYRPLTAESEEREDVNYVDAAVAATEQVLYETNTGDVLIFMPGERDIRESRDQLEGRFARDAEIIPLFGRLSSGEQQRVFAPSQRRKIVIATNIAETSLTIPGIRYVIDAGLARISRYNPRTRTRRLPIEPVSQSSANQRKGRAGRVQDGTCIRLYSEEDFNARPAFTQPEIQRSNLAEVILRMKAFGFGDIETFPFIQPPAPAAIANGYALLQELGALDAQRTLTSLGRDLARLPIDPTLGRMLLQSQREHATRELLIIAAGLSIQDPRERPLDQKDSAAAAHKQFADPQSDFLALLNIWNAVHDQWEKLRTQGQRRKFCKQHFLSYLRMREWQDLHAQLEDALTDVLRASANEVVEPAALRLTAGSQRDPARPGVTAPADLHIAIHRSILSGLIGHVAHREERNTYKTSGNRMTTVFPGSALYDRGEKPIKGRPARPAQSPVAPKKPSQPEWIVAGEIVETSQLFARTVAGIDPQWIYQLAPHCCKVTHQNPHWNVANGRVLIDEIVTLHGLEVQRRKVAYGNLNPKEATAIFIRAALVEEDVLPRGSRREEAPSGRRGRDDWKAEINESLLTSAAAKERELPVQYRFLAHNRAVRQKIENLQTRARHHGLIDLDQALFDFYSSRIENVSSLDELNRLLRDRVAAGILPAVEPGILPGGIGADEETTFERSSTVKASSANPGGKMPPSTSGRMPDATTDRQSFLCASEADLLGDLKLNYDSTAFPDAVKLAEQPLPVRYAYAPGEDWDGVTVQLPVELARSLSPAAVQWAVPGLRAEQVGELLRSLPKALRRELQPIEPKVEEIVRELQPSGDSLSADLGRFILRRYGITIPPDAWRAGAVPAHLRPRVEVVDGNRKTLAAGRSLEELRAQLKDVQAAPDAGSEDWRRAAAKWERTAITSWSFGDVPERIVVRGEPLTRPSAFAEATVDKSATLSPSDGERDGVRACPDRDARPDEVPFLGGARGGLSPTTSDLIVYAWPGLALEDQHVSLRLFRSPDLARAASIGGVGRLIELALQKDLAWLQKDLRSLTQLKELYAPVGSTDELLESAAEHVKRHILPAEPLVSLTSVAFEAAVTQARGRLAGLVPKLSDQLKVILQLRQQIAVKLGSTAPAGASRPRTLTDLSQLGQSAAPDKGNPLAGELNGLLPARFLESIGFERLAEMPRYLKALLTRIERAKLNPVKDQERARQLAAYQDAVKKFRAAPPKSPEGRRAAEEFRWLVEEFKVSLFAQELGTKVPVSAKRLDQQLEQLKMVC
jgi:ATP-dependent helicase HrpA